MGCSPVARAPPPVRPEGTRGARQHAARDARDAHPGDVVELVGCAVQDRLGRTPAAADGGPDPLAQVAAREPGGVAGDEGVVAAYHVDAPAQEVAVAGRIVVRTARQLIAELGGEARPMRLDVLAGTLDALGEAADADVEPAALLGDVPRVPGQALVAEPQVAVRILPVVLDLVLERHDLQLVRARVQPLEQVAVHRAARTTGADEIAAAILA